jgi:Tol biopolymer transport system component
LFIVAARRNQLAALEANGDVRWTLARPDVSNPRWGGTFTDTRIAYVTHAPGQVPALRVVAGDGSGDHWVTKGLFPVAPAWKPGSIRVLAVAHNDGRVRLWNADARALLAASPTKERPVALAWSHDGRRLYALGPRRLDVLDRRARRVRSVPVPDGWTATALAVPPRGRHVALVRTRAGRSAVTVVSPDGAERTVFSHPGRFGDLQWSPDGRWLLVGLSDADQWLFVPVARGLGRSRPVSNIMAQFDSEVSPRLSGWCCPP